MLSTSASALRASGIRLQATAQNIANMNTPGYSPARVDFEDRPDRGGVLAQPYIAHTNPRDYLLPGLEAHEEYESRASFQKDVNGTGFSLEREMTRLVEEPHFFQSNTVALRSWDNSSGALIDLLV